MTLTTLLIIFLVLAMIIAGITVLLKSARPFNLTDEQRKKIKQKNEELDRQEKHEDKF